MLFIYHRAVTLVNQKPGGQVLQRPAAFQNKPAASQSERSLLTVGEEPSEDVTAVTELTWFCACMVGDGVVWQGSEHTLNQVSSLLLSIMGSVIEKCCRILRLMFLYKTIGNFTGCVEGVNVYFCTSQSCTETQVKQSMQRFIITTRRGRAGAD